MQQWCGYLLVQPVRLVVGCFCFGFCRSFDYCDGTDRRMVEAPRRAKPSGSAVVAPPSTFGPMLLVMLQATIESFSGHYLHYSLFEKESRAKDTRSSSTEPMKIDRCGGQDLYFPARMADPHRLYLR